MLLHLPSPPSSGAKVGSLLASSLAQLIPVTLRRYVEANS